MSPTQLGKEFRDFLFKTNVFSMAMGVVIGNAISKVVESIVKDLFMPVVGVVNRSGYWGNVKISFWRFNFTVGNFIGALIDFLVIATVVFAITKLFMRSQAPPPPPPTKPCPECREPVAAEARRCKFCTSALTAA
jgi:large conductance mechanosensitive channel